MNIECFSCAGGMSEGFRRAGIAFHYAFDFAKDHCDSYEANLGHRPVCMDVRDLVRMARDGLFNRDRRPISLFVADPPCTPWSRAGLRKGTTDERDMIEDTCEIIALLRPRAYLIGNVPGLDDSKNWHVVQRVIGGLQRYGYCVADFAALDAADYGVPQHRVRPFWFGHLDGPCIQWPRPTHGDPLALTTLTLPGVDELRPWVTCRQALGHLSPAELGRPVRLRKRNQNSKQHGSVPERPARVVGTSNLSDGNVLLFNDKHPPASLDKPSPTVTSKPRGPGGQLLSSRDRTEFEGGYTPSSWDEPAHAIVRNTHGDGSVLLLSSKHPVSDADQPAMTLRASDGGGTKRVMRIRTPQSKRIGKADAPAKTLDARPARAGMGDNSTLEWPWDRPATVVQADDRLALPGHHDENWDGGLRPVEGAVVLSEKAAAILQGFPESWVFSGKTKKIRWGQIGQAMPPALAHAVAAQVKAQRERADRDRAKHAAEPTSDPQLATGKSSVL
jgi:site-specific DNA-cytosine methylase